MHSHNVQIYVHQTQEFTNFQSDISTVSNFVEDVFISFSQLSMHGHSITTLRHRTAVSGCQSATFTGGRDCCTPGQRPGRARARLTEAKARAQTRARGRARAKALSRAEALTLSLFVCFYTEKTYT